VVLARALLLVRVVGMQIFGKPHIFGRCLLHLRLLSTSKILLEKLWLLWLCDGAVMMMWELLLQSPATAIENF
jgi:hypothetical protein